MKKIRVKRWHYALVGHGERGQARYSRATKHGSFEYPWLGMREAQAEARKHGAVAVFHSKYDLIGNKATAVALAYNEES